MIEFGDDDDELTSCKGGHGVSGAAGLAVAHARTRSFILRGLAGQRRWTSGSEVRTRSERWAERTLRRDEDQGHFFLGRLSRRNCSTKVCPELSPACTSQQS